MCSAIACAHEVMDEGIKVADAREQEVLGAWVYDVLSLPFGAEVYFFLSLSSLAALSVTTTASKALTQPFLFEALSAAMAEESWASKDVPAKLLSLQAFSHLGPHLLSPEKVLPMMLPKIVKHLFDLEPRLRRQALKCMECIVPERSEAASAVIQDKLLAVEDVNGTGEPCVTAILALGQVAEKGNANTISILVTYLDKENVNICMAAGQALGHMAGRGNEEALTLVAKRLSCRSLQMREVALIAFRRLARRGDTVAVDLLASRLDPSKPAMCRAMLDSLRNIARRGDKIAILAVGRLLGTEGGEVRAAAIGAYGCLADLEEPETQATLAALLQDEVADVRQAAKEALATVAKLVQPTIAHIETVTNSPHKPRQSESAFKRRTSSIHRDQNHSSTCTNPAAGTQPAFDAPDQEADRHVSTSVKAVFFQSSAALHSTDSCTRPGMSVKSLDELQPSSRTVAAGCFLPD